MQGHSRPFDWLVGPLPCAVASTHRTVHDRRWNPGWDGAETIGLLSVALWGEGRRGEGEGRGGGGRGERRGEGRGGKERGGVDPEGVSP